MANKPSYSEGDHHRRFRYALLDMEKETIKRCVFTSIEGDSRNPSAVCAISWLGRKANGGTLPWEKMHEKVHTIIGYTPGLITQIYDINDQNPSWTWQRLAQELRAKVLPKVLD